LAAFGSKVAICLPLLLERRAIGVIWVLYRSRVGRRRIDSGTLQRYATEASLVYTNWLGVQGLAQERRAFQEIAGALSFQTAVTLMLDHTVSIFEAKTVTFWPFDSRRWRFSDPQVKGFDELLPRPAKGGATYRILKERGHIAIGDVTDPVAAKDLAPLTVQILRAALAEECPGHLRLPLAASLSEFCTSLMSDARTFGFADVRRLENFAAGVATLLHVVRVLEDARRERRAAREVSGALALGDVEEAKRAVASRALKALRCDTVTIHQLDDSGTRPVFPAGDRRRLGPHAARRGR
jgi:hypothetical protein